MVVDFVIVVVFCQKKNEVIKLFDPKTIHVKKNLDLKMLDPNKCGSKKDMSEKFGSQKNLGSKFLFWFNKFWLQKFRVK